uniref:FtsX-like permease family protein n=1 Tax=candidate division WOR-3 bacterium TaxID=2052148 RepID=A0A7C3UV32_UNCW3
MNLIEYLKLAFDTFRTHKLRSFLTTLGIIIGVMTVISIISLIQGLNATVEKQIQSLGSNSIYIQKVSWGTGRIDFEEVRKRKDLTLDDAQAIASLPSVFKVSPLRSQNLSQITYEGNKYKMVEVIGSNSDLQFTANYSVAIGRFIQEDDYQRARKVCCIGSEIAENLFPNTDPIGKYLNLSGHRFTVVGILTKKGSFLGQTQDNVIIIPLTAFEQVFEKPTGRVFEALSIIAIPRSARDLEKAIDEIRELLRRRRRLRYDQPDDFGINTQETLREIYKNITRVAFLVMIVVAGISLLVGGIGIMNIMLVAVAERTREIGLRKAVGASARAILFQFLIESLVLSLIGGGIGVASGLSIAKIVQMVAKIPAAAPFWTILLGFGFSVAVGIFFGIYPATRAAKLNPISALRYE